MLIMDCERYEGLLIERLLKIIEKESQLRKVIRRAI